MYYLAATLESRQSFPLRLDRKRSFWRHRQAPPLSDRFHNRLERFEGIDVKFGTTLEAEELQFALEI